MTLEVHIAFLNDKNMYLLRDQPMQDQITQDRGYYNVLVDHAVAHLLGLW
jgi:hypothetical protein